MAPAARYIATVGALLTSLVVYLLVASRHEDFLLAKPFPGDPRSYRAFDNFPHPEIQDRDVYFHNIGQSIEAAKQADIIILGHSVWLYGLDDVQVRAFNARHGVRIFNMASAGNSSGDFIRAVIKRWDIHPQLWIINDDDEAVSFFHPGIDDAPAPTGSASSMEIVKTGRATGFELAFARNLRWALWDLVGYLSPEHRARWFPQYDYRFEAWRSTETGDWLFEPGSMYDRAGGPPFTPPHRDCPLPDAEIGWVKNFLADIGGNTVLTLVPYARWCPQRVTETAAKLGLEAILPPSTDYTNLDGRHMDRHGAKAYTAWFLSALETTNAFAAIVSKRVNAGH